MCIVQCDLSHIDYKSTLIKSRECILKSSVESEKNIMEEEQFSICKPLCRKGD